MIYTIGHKANYEEAINTHGAISKTGKNPEYEGGTVFETEIDAMLYLTQIGQQDTWCVWGVDADWITDTLPASDGSWHYLLYDAQIIPLNR